ncbi:MAG: undecaprenyl-diphosphate phosphatase [Clostridiales bacterium]|jgi:undecaprenyl-diphosphatase|nr:undecaprenyl-diphosphate phosphatase [Clostridiales bacterium]
MSLLEAIIQGIIQGATEFLPVSSSGHLTLSQHVMGVQVESILFDVLLHFGTLMAVVFVYHKLIGRLIVECFRLIKAVVTGKFQWSQRSDDQNLLFMLLLGLAPLFLLFLPVPGTGQQIKDFADQWSTDGDIVLEGVALLVTSLLLALGIFAAKRTQKLSQSQGREQYRVRDALFVGVTQCFAAVFPGLSRSGSTLSVGLLCGINRQKALDYSFVLGIPAILAAVVLSVGDAIHEPVQIGTAPLVAGVVTAAVVGFLAIKLFKWMVTANKMHLFVWYTLLLGIATIIVGLIEHSMGINVFTGMPLR